MSVKHTKTINTDETLIIIKNICSPYLRNPEYVYKSCEYINNVYLIVLKKLPTTKTNETRIDITNTSFAAFRASELEIIMIINILNPNKKIDLNYQFLNKCYKDQM